MKAISLRLFRKKSQQLESFRVSPQNLYIGSPSFYSVPLVSILQITYKSLILTVHQQNSSQNEEFEISDPEIASKIQKIVRENQLELKKSLENIKKQLAEGLYFVSCTFVDAWNTNRSPRTSLGSSTWSTLNGKEKKIIWIDEKYLFVGKSKSNLRKTLKICLCEITRIMLEECNETGNYKMIIFSQSQNSQNMITLYSSDFGKIRECVIGLEQICKNTENSKYDKNIKAQTRIGILFIKTIKLLKEYKKETESINFADFFNKLKDKPEEIEDLVLPSELSEPDELTPSDFNDTKKLTNLLNSTTNPQNLVKETKSKIARQLSIYTNTYVSHSENQSEISESPNMRSTSGLFRARLSPIKMPIQIEVSDKNENGEERKENKVFDSCCSDAMDLLKKPILAAENSKVFTVEHSFSIEKPSNLTEEPGKITNEDIPFETARFKKTPPLEKLYSQQKTEREFEYSIKNTKHLEENNNFELLQKYNKLKEKSHRNKEIIQSQSVEIGKMQAKCEMQAQKIIKLKKNKEKSEQDFKNIVEKLQLELSQYKEKFENSESENKRLKLQNEEFQQKLQKISENKAKFMNTNKENTGPHQHIEITQNVIEFRPAKAQIPKISKKSDTNKKLNTTFKDIITTILK